MNANDSIPPVSTMMSQGESTTRGDTTWDRGAIINHYSKFEEWALEPYFYDRLTDGARIERTLYANEILNGRRSLVSLQWSQGFLNKGTTTRDR